MKPTIFAIIALTEEQIADFEKGLSPFLPADSISMVVAFIVEHGVHFTVSRKRKTKLGDYRQPFNGQPHRISVNGDLNKYAFLVTTLHEMAHLVVYNNYGNRVKPHGTEWKTAFLEISQPLLNRGIFPEDVTMALTNYLKNARASSCADPRLYRVLSRYDKHQPVRVEDLKKGTIFKLNGKIFVKGKKLRTRFECEDVYSRRKYRVLGLAEIDNVVEETNEQ